MIVSVAPDSVYLGEEYFYQIQIEDPDDIEFIIEIEGEPEGMTLEGNLISCVTWPAKLPPWFNSLA